MMVADPVKSRPAFFIFNALPFGATGSVYTASTELQKVFGISWCLWVVCGPPSIMMITQVLSFGALLTIHGVHFGCIGLEVRF